MRYPQRAVEKEVQGTIIIQFTVTPGGATLDPLIIQSAEYSLDQEALRIIIASKTWIPATQDGKRIEAMHHLPITSRME